MTTLVLLAKEIKSLFSSWIAYVVLISFTLLNGIRFYFYLGWFEYLTRKAENIEESVSRQNWNLLEQLIFPLYESILVLIFVMVPAITMRTLAEEKKQKTEELLFTSPIKTTEIVLAKYLAACALIFLMMAPAIMYPSIVMYYGKPTPDWGPMVTGFIGLYILGFSLASVGLFSSSLTENQIVALIIAVAIESLFFVLGRSTINVDVVRIGDLIINVGAFLSAFSLTEHYFRLRAGIVRASDLVYFGSFILFWLWATKKSLERARW